MLGKRTKFAALPLPLMAFMLAVLCHGQDLYRFQNYTHKEGLPSEFLNGLIQDSLGFIWINYASGLARFDGYTFRTYTHDVEDTTRSPGKGTVGVFFQDHVGNFWLRPSGLTALDLLLMRYDSRKDRFDRYKIAIKDSTVSRICIDRNEKDILWLGTYGHGICRVDLSSKAVEPFVIPEYSSFNKKRCNWVRGVWDCGTFLNISTLDGMWRFDKQSRTFSRPRCNPADTLLMYYSNIGIGELFNSLRGVCSNGQAWLQIEERFNKNPPITFAQVTEDLSIIKRYTLSQEQPQPLLDCDTSDFVWIQTKEGPARYNIKNGSTEIVRFLTPNPLADAQVSGLTVDDQNNLWVGTYSGITKASKASLEFDNIPLKGISSAQLYTHPPTNQEFLVICVDTRGPTSDVIIAPIDHNRLDITKFKKLATFNFERIVSIALGRKTLWLSTTGGIFGLPIDDKSGLPSKEPSVVYGYDSSTPNTISSVTPLTIWEDPQENLWVTTKANGFYKIDRSVPYGENGSIITFKHDPKNSHSLGDDNVYHVFPGNNESIWLITDTGIDLLHNAFEPPGTQKFEHVFENKSGPADFIITSDSMMYVGTYRGLYKANLNEDKYEFRKIREINNMEISSMMQDSLGRLWLFNYGGAVCLDINKRSVTTFDEDDGILYTQVNGGLLNKIQLATGIWILIDDEGITSFDPMTLRIDESHLRPDLTRLMINNKEVRAGQAFDETNISFVADIAVLDELSLDYRHNNFTIEFSALEMTDPEKNLYRHMLEGYDPEWIETDYKNRTATYTNLDPGTYTFRVRASNHHGVWSDQERRLKVIILPPPWKTWWAYSIYTMIAVALLFLARRMIVQRERLKGSLKLAKVEQEKEHFELEKAKEVDRVKTSFFTNISHEFRTPLTLIKGPVQNILERYKDDPKLQEQLKLVQRNSDLLLKLINQLLDLAKLESGTMKIENSQSDVHSFIRAIASSFESLARQKNLLLSVEVPSYQHVALFDRDKLETIIINLVNNAIKFTPSGGKISVRAESTNDSITIRVHDTGTGIPIEHQQKIFERFHQVSEAHKEVGTGIGLSLVKELVQLLSGTIDVKSEPGKGTTFTVMLPVELAAEGSEPAIVEEVPIHLEHSSNQLHTPSDNGGTERPHVLVVEDNDDLRAFIIDSLGNEFHFLEADNGRKGLDIATNEIPDLIISDIMMPEMDGITMAAKIKSDHRSNHIPLILLTAKSTEDSKLQGLKSGADDYLTKPFNKEELLLKVRNGISRQVKLREKLRAELMATAPKVEVLSEDERFLIGVKEKILERLSDEQLSVESLAEDIGISRVHLYRKVSGLTGLSVNELIRKLRLQRAAQLLSQNWGPVSQVAYEVGYSNLSYFSKMFKEEFGTLPSEYEKA